MKGQRTVKYVLGVSLSVVLLCGSLRAGPGFLDDFSDGSVQDGSPVSWWWEDDGQGECVVTNDGFRIEPNPGGYPWACVLDRQLDAAVYASNMTIRTQFRMDNYSDGAHAGIWFRLSEGGNFYLAGIYQNKLYLSWSGNHEWHFFRQCTIPGYDAAQHDIIIQVDVTDFTDASGSRMSRLEVRAWTPGQDKPAQPQISVVDGKYDAGMLMLYAYQSPATFRWVEVVAEQAEPIVDFNGDGKVDIQDLLKVIGCWGQDDPAVDIVPDGVVDRKDLEALMDHWQQEVNDPTLVAHWALDETEGTIAHDSVGLTPGTVLGDAVWRPDAGRLEGALEFDGVDDVITAGEAVKPSSAPFSVLAWAKGGAPGQVIFSQASGVNWLMADPATGALMTELKSMGRFSRSLSCDAVIADGDWHRVGFTWDGAARMLYVDDVLAAEDTQTELAACKGGVLIGCGSNMAPGTFWSGLIDDVRIYNRAVNP